MRNDVKLGFAIGGVLLAVLTVYVLTTGSSNKPAPAGAPAADGRSQHPDIAAPPSETGALGSAENPTGTGAPSAPAVAFAPPTTAPSEATARADSRSGDLDWGKLLSGEQPMPLMTQTPTPSDPRTAAPVPAGSPTAIQPAPGAFPAPSLTPSASPAAPVVTTTIPPSAIAPIDIPPLVAATPATQPTRTHVVQRGETLSSIAAAAYGSANYYPHILRANPNINERKLRPGMTITLPDVTDVRPHDLPGGPVAEPPAVGVSTTGNANLIPVSATAPNEYRVKPNDSLYKISINLYGRSDRAEKIYDLNKQLIGPDPAKVKPGMLLKLPEPPTVAPAR